MNPVGNAGNRWSSLQISGTRELSIFVSELLSCRRRRRGICRRARGRANAGRARRWPVIWRSKFDLVELVVAVGVADAIEAVGRCLH